ncbi:MAG: PAS domain-containing protein [Chloroflexota bacterium]
MRESPDKTPTLEAIWQKYNLAPNPDTQFMTLINRNYAYEAANESYCRAHRLAREEIIGRTVADVWGQGLFDYVLKEYLDSCLAGREVRHQSWFEFPSLGYRYFDVAYYPCATDGGRVSHAAVFSRDITGHGQLPETLQHTYAALEARAQQEVAALSQANEALCATVAQREQEVAALQAAKAELERLVQARMAEWEETVAQLQQVREGETVAVVLPAEEAPPELRVEESPAETRSEWLPNVGRQLQIPLRTILDLCAGLRQELFGPINDQQRYALFSLEASGQHVLNVVHGLADPEHPAKEGLATTSLKSLFKGAWRAIRPGGRREGPDAS